MYKPTKHTFAALLIVALSIWSQGGAEVVAEVLPNSQAEPVVESVLGQRIQQSITANTENLGTRTAEALRVLYAARAYRPVFIDEKRVLPHLSTLVEGIHTASEHGLLPDQYKLAELAAIRKDRSELAEDELLHIEINATGAAVSLTLDLFCGRADASQLGKGWGYGLTCTRSDALAIVDKMAAKKDFHDISLEASPIHPEYKTLVAALKRFRALSQKEWKDLPSDKKFKIGDNGEPVARLVEKLIIIGALPANQAPVYDNAVEEAIKAFQRKNHLKDDGIIGPDTLSALNTSPSDRADQIVANMERLRWLPRKLEDRRVEVNIPGYTLVAYDKNRPVLNMPTIVGKKYSNTPVMRGEITKIELNPYWNIPNKIFVDEILPKVRDNPQHFADKHLEVVGKDKKPRPTEVLDWDTFDPDALGVRVRQTPGKWNELGQYKFILPNDEDIFLHDTRNEELFKEEERAFSHGCIRVEKPLELALNLLEEAPEWSRERITAQVSGGEQAVIPIPQPVPVYLMYKTVEVMEDGVAFFRDIYDADKRLAQLLKVNKSHNENDPEVGSFGSTSLPPS